MYILTDDGKVVSGEPLTDAQARVHIELPAILRKCQYAFVGTSESKHLADHLIKHFDMKLRTKEVEVVPDPEVEEVVYPVPVLTSDDPMF